LGRSGDCTRPHPEMTARFAWATSALVDDDGPGHAGRPVRPERLIGPIRLEGQLNRSLGEHGSAPQPSAPTVRVDANYPGPTAVACFGRIDRSIESWLQLIMPQPEVLLGRRDPRVADDHPPPTSRWSKETRRSVFFEMKSLRNRRCKENAGLANSPQGAHRRPLPRSIHASNSAPGPNSRPSHRRESGR
jgi:hypothetical protein